MPIRVHLDAQNGGEKQEIISWRFRNREPYTDNEFTGLSLEKNYLFTCKNLGCGHAEFSDSDGGIAECENCQEQYVFGWLN